MDDPLEWFAGVYDRFPDPSFAQYLVGWADVLLAAPSRAREGAATCTGKQPGNFRKRGPARRWEPPGGRRPTRAPENRVISRSDRPATAGSTGRSAG